MNKIAKRVSAAFMAGVAALALTACSEDKPSKDEVKQGIMDAAVEEFGQDLVDILGEDVLSDYFGCIVDEIYDETSADTLKAIADEGMQQEMPENEKKVFEEASKKCEEKLV